MITAPAPFTQAKPWQTHWREAIRDPRQLLALLGLDALATTISDAAAAQFPLRVPRGFAAKMAYGDANDPLLRQVLPVIEEDRIVPGFTLDAVGDAGARAASGIIHKYEGRALLITTGSCAVHCRYCFRRHFPYAEETAAAHHWQTAIDYLKTDPSITEVILSGGDPLSLSTAKLIELTDALQGLPPIRRLRLHTRLPIVLPERVDAELLAWLRSLPWPVALVVHANHPNEIDAPVQQSLAALRQAGVVLLNQAVLLGGVNDHPDTLIALSESLFAAGVLPYYLHLLDRVAGTAHFEVSEAQAQALQSVLMAKLPGYLVPRLVREVEGAASKLPGFPH